MHEVVEQAETLRKVMTSGIVRDSQAFEKVMEAFKLPKETEAQQATRQEAIEQATLDAIKFENLIPGTLRHGAAMRK